MAKATKPGLDILKSCGGHASHWVKDIEFESAIAVWASAFALKTAHIQLVCSVSMLPPSSVTKGQHLLYILCHV